MLARRHSFPTDASPQAGRHRCRAARWCSREWYSPGILAQSNRPAWGGARHRGCREASAKASFSSRWVRIFSITTRSSMQARACPASVASALGMIFTAPPHSRQISMSISPRAPTFGEHPLKTLRLYALWVQLIDARRSAGVCSSPASVAFGLFTLPRLAGVTNARCWLLGANTPWKGVRLTRGLGTRAATRAMKSNGSKITNVRGPITVRCLELVPDIAIWRQ